MTKLTIKVKLNGAINKTALFSVEAKVVQCTYLALPEEAKISSHTATLRRRTGKERPITNSRGYAACWGWRMCHRLLEKGWVYHFAHRSSSHITIAITLASKAAPIDSTLMVGSVVHAVCWKEDGKLQLLLPDKPDQETTEKYPRSNRRMQADS
ncbi:hypothetical protein Tco_0213583 [Tanacetum coccineum]